MPSARRRGRRHFRRDLRPSGKAVANAEILAINEATHITRSVVSTAEGVFRVALLPPGTYTVTVKAAGFADRNLPSIPVTVSETSSLNVKLSLAEVNASVQVAGSPEIVETESSTLGRAVEPEAIQTLPLANRNYTQILGFRQA